MITLKSSSFVRVTDFMLLACFIVVCCLLKEVDLLFEADANKNENVFSQGLSFKERWNRVNGAMKFLRKCI